MNRCTAGELCFMVYLTRGGNYVFKFSDGKRHLAKRGTRRFLEIEQALREYNTELVANYQPVVGCTYNNTWAGIPDAKVIGLLLIQQQNEAWTIEFDRHSAAKPFMNQHAITSEVNLARMTDILVMLMRTI